jgi:hypothetical protein
MVSSHLVACIFVTSLGFCPSLHQSLGQLRRVLEVTAWCHIRSRPLPCTTWLAPCIRVRSPDTPFMEVGPDIPSLSAAFSRSSLPIFRASSRHAYAPAALPPVSLHMLRDFHSTRSAHTLATSRPTRFERYINPSHPRQFLFSSSSFHQHHTNPLSLPSSPLISVRQQG